MADQLSKMAATIIGSGWIPSVRIVLLEDESARGDQSKELRSCTCARKQHEIVHELSTDEKKSTKSS